jgi:hypothetical protein
MRLIALVLGIVCCFGVVLDALQTIILPRRPTGRVRLTRFFYILTWRPLVAVAQRVRDHRVREQIYSAYGPVSLLLLLGLWASVLVFGFGCLYFALGTPFSDAVNPHGPFWAAVRTDLYVSGTATELLRRHGHEGGERDLARLLEEWERWSAEILETHISYPILCYYRSQHDNQSWLSGLVAVLDACALLITTIEGPPARQAQLTFAMGRHALVDIGHVFHLEKINETLPPEESETERLPKETFYRLCGELGDMHMRLCGDPAAQQRLTAIRTLYEPHAQVLAEYLKMPLPLWVAEPKKNDAWKKVADLRMGAGAAETLLNAIEHVSDRSTATHLHEEEHGF